MFGFLTMLLAAAAAVFGFSFARNFVRRRLGYIDAVHATATPLVAGAAATVLAMPLAWLLPLVGTGTAVVFGASVGIGIAAGAKDIRRRLRPG